MYYFIVNPMARCGRGYRIWKKLEKRLMELGIDYEARMTQKTGDAKAIAKGLTEGCKDSLVIVTVGGDGTINEVLDGLAFCGPITLGYIPAGSGNDLARSLKLPKKPRRCLKKIIYPKYHQQLDYGVLSYGDDEIVHRRFMVSAGIGFDAAVCHNLLYSRFRTVLNRMGLGKLSYIMIGCKQLMQAKSVKGYLLLDGTKKVEFNHIYFISAHIHPYEGGGFKFAPKADYSDGKLSICVVSQTAKRRLLPILLGAYTGKHKRYKGVRYYECQEVLVHTERPMAVHVDGESCFTQKDLQIRCIKKKLRMIV